MYMSAHLNHRPSTGLMSCSMLSLIWPTMLVAMALVAATAIVAAAGPRLNSSGLIVELDSRLPMPVKVFHLSTGVDFSPPQPRAGPPPAAWWQYIANHALVSGTGDEGCAPPHCSTVGPYHNGSANCSRACVDDCVGWSIAKDTPSSGRHGKGNLCQLYSAAGLASRSPFYVADPNFDCGSNVKLQPNRPSTLSMTSSCVEVVAVNGSTILFCADRNETSTVYSTSPSGHRLEWTLLLTGPGNVKVELVGSAAVEEDDSTNSSVLSWSLISARSQQFKVRAVDLGFAFVGLAGAGDRYYYTQSHNAWLPPSVSGMAWRCDTLEGTVGVKEKQEALASIVQKDSYPPLPLPFAAQALLDPSRSNGVGAWTADGKAGVGAYSSQLTLPFRRFHHHDSSDKGSIDAAGAESAASTSAIGLGSARINTHLRCGSVLPVHLRFGMYNDVTADGKANADDSTVWTRSNYALADFVYRGSVTMKIDNDISSYLMPWNPSPNRVTFNQTLDYIAATAALTDNMPMVMHLVGWGGTGLDTGIYNEINQRLGSLSDLLRLKEKALMSYNTIVSYHVDTDNVYANLTACSDKTDAGDWDDTSGHPVAGTRDGQPTPGFDAMTALTPDGEYWIWDATSAPMRTDPLQGPCYHISKTKDVASGGRLRRFEEMFATVPMSEVLHMDAYRDIDISWERSDAGFISEDEEAACGLGWDLQWLQQHNLSLGVEGPNGMASVGGPNSPAMNMFDYYWREATLSLGEWGRIVLGTAQGVDSDMPYAHVGCWAHKGCNCSANKCSANATTNPFGHWESLADTIYLQAKPYALTLTGAGAGGELMSYNKSTGEMRYGNGGTNRQWPHGESMIEYYRPKAGGRKRSGNYKRSQVSVGAAVFVPEVLLPPPGSPRTAPTMINPCKVFAYLHSGGAAQNLTWQMPDTWSGKQIQATTITPYGRVQGQPAVHVRGKSLVLELAPGRPVVLTVPTSNE